MNRQAHAQTLKWHCDDYVTLTASGLNKKRKCWLQAFSLFSDIMLSKILLLWENKTKDY